MYSVQEQISKEVPSSFQVGECFKTYTKPAATNPTMTSKPNYESDSTDNLNNYSETVVDGSSLPKHTVINFYSVAGQSDGTEVNLSDTCETASKNAVRIPMTHTIPAYAQHLPATTSSLDLDEDYDE